MKNQILQGDVLEKLKEIEDESVDCVVTSPPYFGLRDYGVKGQIGLEKTPDVYVAKLVSVFREIRRVLKPEGTCWLNLGDSYSSSRANGNQGKNGQRNGRKFTASSKPKTGIGLKDKDLIGPAYTKIAEKRLHTITMPLALGIKSSATT